MVARYLMDSHEGEAGLDDVARDMTERRQPWRQRLFLWILGLERTRRDVCTAFTQVMEPAARVRWERGYTPQEETYREVKRQLLGHEDYRFKVLVRLDELPG